jgi:hypothetical protein
MIVTQNNITYKKNNMIKIVANKIQESEVKNNQYSLKNNLFDPSKSSPPNEFMLKLYNRVSAYETYSLPVSQM